MEKENLQTYKSALRNLLLKKAVRRGKVKLSSGRISNFYIDGRLVTLNSQGAYLAARIILELLKDKNIRAIGGPTIGADPICGALAAMAHLQGRKLDTFIVRKSKKEYGRGRQIEGPLPKKGSSVALVDDVATTGGSLIEAKEILKQAGLRANLAIVLVDRQEGAKENLKKHGIQLLSIFKKNNLL